MADAQVKEDEVVQNAEGKVAVLIEPLGEDAEPTSFRIIDPATMQLDILCKNGAKRRVRFPAHSREAWQLLIDTATLLVTEVVDPEKDVPADERIVRDLWIYAAE